ncbi:MULTISPECIES: hypothetical protein [unclassified Nocardioides]|uniref:AtuA-related protein n=1 Tax=unclassified Nocardioides TaxID=2615069 RepID=UPI0007030A4C|nr:MULTISPECIES: hypothetical protein [unclassified Nocardioides]KQZ74987.1 hypothetical protein ASD66_01000 [Nocardioides sp. Root151]KRF10520.1 hypothetical protein ASH02_20725 [Nocardioides sp. Soil796]
MNDVLLHDVAHARAGDKGDTSILSLFPLDDADYEWLVREVTAERVEAHFAGEFGGRVQRFELPNVHGLQFVCRQALAGGVTTSLAIDTHGKSLSSRLLSLRIAR